MSKSVLAEKGFLETVDARFSVGEWDSLFSQLNEGLDRLLEHKATSDIAGAAGTMSLRAMRDEILEECRSLDVSDDEGISANLGLLMTELGEWDAEFADMLAREPIDLSQDLSIVLTCASTMKCALARLFRECDALRKLAWAHRKFYDRLEEELDADLGRVSDPVVVDDASDPDAISEEESIDEVVDEMVEEDIDGIVESVAETAKAADEPVLADEHPVDEATAALSNLIRACSRDSAPVPANSVFLGTVTHDEDAKVIVDDVDDATEFIPDDTEDIPFADDGGLKFIGEDENGIPLIAIDEEIDPSPSVMLLDMLEEQRMMEQLEARQSMDPDEYYAYVQAQDEDDASVEAFVQDFDEEAFAESVKTNEQKVDERIAEDMSRMFDVPTPTLTAVVSHDEPVIEDSIYTVEEEQEDDKDDLSRMVEIAAADTGVISHEQMELIAEDTGTTIEEVISSAMDLKNDRAMADKPDLKTEPH